MTKKTKRYNDGVVSIYREKAQTSSFKTNVKSLSDMEFVVKLDFEELSKRQQDAEFADQNNFTLSRKIRTRRVNGIGVKCKAVIEGIVYDVSYVDTDRTDAFIYLDEIRGLEVSGSVNT